MKNFTREKWKISLAKKIWEAIGEMENVAKMAEIFNMQVTEALDECAPMKEIKIRRHHKFGLGEDTKKMIKERDSLRKKIGKARRKDKGKIQDEYKKLRNKIIGKVRKDTVEFNEERAEEAENENEAWKIVNDIKKTKIRCLMETRRGRKDN